MSNDMTPVEEYLILTATASAIAERRKELEPKLLDELDDGDQKRPSVQGIPLGSLSRAVRAKVPQVTDEAAFFAHMDSVNRLGDERYLDPANTAEIVEVLLEHAPHLVSERLVVDSADREAEFKRVELGAEVPGVELVDKPVRGSGLTPRPSKEAKARVAQALASGLLALEEGDRG